MDGSAKTLRDVFRVLCRIDNRLARLDGAQQQFPPAWLDLQDACQLKGVNYNSLSNSANAWRRPRGGVPDGILNGRAHWRPETVAEWIMQDDEDLYLRYGGEEI
jgi:hypothetical protein